MSNTRRCLWGVLLGRRLALSRDLVENVPTAGRELLKVLGGRDQVGIWLYNDLRRSPRRTLVLQESYSPISTPVWTAQ